MARPKKQPGELRTVSLAFRLTPDERLQIESSARNAGMSASDFARSQALKGRVVVNEHRTLEPAVFEELRRIGVNLNQLTRMAHVKEKMPPSLPQLLGELERLIARELAG